MTTRPVSSPGAVRFRRTGNANGVRRYYLFVAPLRLKLCARYCGWAAWASPEHRLWSVLGSDSRETGLRVGRWELSVRTNRVDY